MRIHTVELITVSLPLVSPFTTSFGTQVVRNALLVKITGLDSGLPVVGWGECVAGTEPVYSDEFVAASRLVLAHHLVPLLFAAQDAGVDITPELVAGILHPVVGHRMSKTALELAVLDAQLRADHRSFASYLGVSATRVPSGVSVGIQPSIDALVETVGAYLDEGYRRIKLKIKPGWDLEPVRAVRAAFGDVPLQVDANAAYSLSDARLLARLDEFDLLLIEQPLAEDDLRQHALLARQLSTPICLDESIVSAARAADAIAWGAASIINVKPGRVGGYLESRRIHDIAVANGIGLWCGGMLETGIGRAANAALAGLPGFTLVGDISASSRFYARDITAPFVLDDGYIAIPTAPGIGVEPIAAVLEETTVDAVEIVAP